MDAWAVALLLLLVAGHLSSGFGQEGDRFGRVPVRTFRLGGNCPQEDLQYLSGFLAKYLDAYKGLEPGSAYVEAAGVPTIGANQCTYYFNLAFQATTTVADALDKSLNRYGLCLTFPGICKEYLDVTGNSILAPGAPRPRPVALPDLPQLAPQTASPQPASKQELDLDTAAVDPINPASTAGALTAAAVMPMSQDAPTPTRTPEAAEAAEAPAPAAVPAAESAVLPAYFAPRPSGRQTRPSSPPSPLPASLPPSSTPPLSPELPL